MAKPDHIPVWGIYNRDVKSFKRDARDSCIRELSPVGLAHEVAGWNNDGFVVARLPEIPGDEPTEFYDFKALKAERDAKAKAKAKTEAEAEAEAKPDHGEEKLIDTPHNQIIASETADASTTKRKSR